MSTPALPDPKEDLMTDTITTGTDWTEPVPDHEKAQRVFNLLAAEPRQRLTIWEIADETGMSLAQTRKGWKLVRDLLGQLAVMEPHRENSVYFLTDDFDDGAQYVFWQTRQVYSRVKSERRTLASLQTATAHRADVQNVLAEAEANLAGTWSNLRQVIRALGVELKVDSAELAKILAD